MLECLFGRVIGVQAFIIFKKETQHSCFPVNIAESLRTALFKNNLFKKFLIYLYLHWHFFLV